MINLFDRTHRRHRAGARLRDTAVIAESIAALWPSKEISERALVLGKIENLRVARLAFDGIELSRGEVLSFWAQLGRPSRSRGFVIGRELREGCLVPSIGDGLCQLSSALYDAVLKAGFEVVERSAHSQIIPGSAAARYRDATVFWNYVDLRYHVLMHALPMTRIHIQLETAAARYPDEPTLRDFRADQALLRDEREALDGAERWIGPHAGMLRLAGEKAQALPWLLPAADIANRERRPDPCACISLRRVWCEKARWQAVALHRIEHAEDALAFCDVVVLPAWVEHEPRVLLAAIASGIPVIATAACGLGDLTGWSEVPAGDVDALRVALTRISDAIVANTGSD